VRLDKATPLGIVPVILNCLVDFYAHNPKGFKQCVDTLILSYSTNFCVLKKLGKQIKKDLITLIENILL
jgi:tyrosine-protein phosphatase YwqE